MTSKRLLTVVCMMLMLMLAVVLAYIINSVATRIAVLVIWAVTNLMFLRLQERCKTEVKTRKYLPIIFAIFGFSLIYVGVNIPELFFLAWIGTWIVIASLFYEFYRWRKKLKKEGKEVIL